MRPSSPRAAQGTLMKPGDSCRGGAKIFCATLMAWPSLGVRCGMRLSRRPDAWVNGSRGLLGSSSS